MIPRNIFNLRQDKTLLSQELPLTYAPDRTSVNVSCLKTSDACTNVLTLSVEHDFMLSYIFLVYYSWVALHHCKWLTQTCIIVKMAPNVTGFIGSSMQFGNTPSFFVTGNHPIIESHSNNNTAFFFLCLLWSWTQSRIESHSLTLLSEDYYFFAINQYGVVF